MESTTENITVVTVLLRTQDGRTVQAVLDRPVQRQVMETMRYHIEGHIGVITLDDVSIGTGEELPLTKADRCECKHCRFNRTHLGHE